MEYKKEFLVLQLKVIKTNGNKGKMIQLKVINNSYE